MRQVHLLHLFPFSCNFTSSSCSSPMTSPQSNLHMLKPNMLTASFHSANAASSPCSSNLRSATLPLHCFLSIACFGRRILSFPPRQETRRYRFCWKRGKSPPIHLHCTRPDNVCALVAATTLSFRSIAVFPSPAGTISSEPSVILNQPTTVEAFVHSGKSLRWRRFPSSPYPFHTAEAGRSIGRG